MGDKAKDIWSKIKGFAGKLGKKLWIIVGAVAAVILLIVILVVWQNSNKNYTVLFTGLNSEDMQSVTTFLADSGVSEYEIQGTDTIRVPAEQEPGLKAQLLMQGYPKSGFGYETYLKNVGSLSTESDRRTMYLYDLQDRLGAFVRSLEGVQDAQVNIAAGEDRRYVLGQDDVLKASAAVIVTMKNGEELSSKQANAIRSLVSRSVQGLEIEQINITDSLGNTYDGTDVDSQSSDSDLRFALEERVNNNIRKHVLEVLVPIFGAENVSVGVNTTVEMSNRFVESTNYTEPDWAADGSTNGEGIVGKKIWQGTIVRGDEAPGGVVGTTTNADLPTYVERAPVNGNEQELQASGEKDYLVDTTHTQQEILAGTVSDVMVSVTINSNVPNQADADALLGHVARAAGISADVQAEKISVISHPFYVREEAPGNEPAVSPNLLGIVPNWVLYALIAGVLLFMTLFIMVLSMQRKKQSRMVLDEVPVLPIIPDAMPEPVDEAPAEGADIMEVHAERSMELRRGVREFAEQNPEIAAQMVKTWLKGDEDNRGSEN